jgi:hypothetical protein
VSTIIILVAERVHVLPESAVVVDGELAVVHEAAQRLLLPDGGVALDVVEHARLADEEAAVDQVAVGGGLLAEAVHPVRLRREVERAEAARLQHRRHGGERALLAVEGDQRADVDVGDPVAVGQAEGLVAEIVAHAAEPSAGHGLEPGVGEGDAPGLALDPVDLDRVGGEVDRHVVGAVEEFQEVLLDHVALVAAADHEVGQPVGGVDLHDVPEHRPGADLDERLGQDGGLLAQPGAVAAGENHDLHRYALLKSRYRIPCGRPVDRPPPRASLPPVPPVRRSRREAHTISPGGRGSAGVL